MRPDISYPKTEKILLEYVCSLPEESKEAFFEKYRKSNSNDFCSMIDNYFYTLGMISMNIDFVNETQCHAYVKFQPYNAWSIDKGLLSSSEHTLSFITAQELLGSYIVELLKQTPIK